jgi:hypothetical protein
MAADLSYQLYLADLWECPSCHLEIVAGFGVMPIAEHFHKDYERERKKQSEKLLIRFWGSVNDKDNGLRLMKEEAICPL